MCYGKPFVSKLLIQTMRFCPSPESTRLWLDYDKNQLKNRLNCDKTGVNLRSWSEHACRSQNSCSHCCATAQYQNCYFRAINDGIAIFRPIILVYTRYLASHPGSPIGITPGDPNITTGLFIQGSKGVCCHHSLVKLCFTVQLLLIANTPQYMHEPSTNHTVEFGSTHPLST